MKYVAEVLLVIVFWLGLVLTAVGFGWLLSEQFPKILAAWERDPAGGTLLAGVALAVASGFLLAALAKKEK